jgi:hypothetical protein
MGLDCGVAKSVLFGGSMFVLFVSMLAGCIMFSCYIDQTEPKEKKKPMNLYTFKYQDIALCSAIFSAIACLVICITIVLYLVGLPDMIVLILGIVSIVISLGAIVCEGLFYDNSLYAFTYQQKIYNKSAHVKWFEELTEKLWGHAVDYMTAYCKDEEIACADYQKNSPSWEDEKKNIDDKKHLFIDLWGNSFAGCSFDECQAPHFKFHVSGDYVKAHVYNSDLNLYAEDIILGTTRPYDDQIITVKNKYYWWEDLDEEKETFKLKSSKFETSYNAKDLGSLSLSDYSVEVIDTEGFYSFEIDDYTSAPVPSGVVALTYEQTKDIPLLNLFSIKDYPKDITYHLKGYSYDDMKKLHKNILKSSYSGRDIFCGDGKPTSGQHEDLVKAGCSIEMSERIKYYLNDKQWKGFINNVKVYPGKYLKKYAEINYKPAIFSYKYESEDGFNQFKLAQFGFAICLIEACAIAVWIVQVVIGFVCGGSRVSNSP